MKKNNEMATPFSAILAIVLLMCFAAPAAAQFDAYSFRIGKLTFSEKPERLTIAAPMAPPLHVPILPTVGEWPPVLLEENGTVGIGEVVFDSASGKIAPSRKEQRGFIQLTRGLSVKPDKHGFTLNRRGTRCHVTRTALGLSKDKSPRDYLKWRYLRIVPSDTAVLALTRQDIDEPGKPAHAYAVSHIDMAGCKVSGKVDLGDPDFLVELAWSRNGGWWITGAIETTLLRSNDGVTWTQVPFNGEISGLISSYAVSDSEIWLAGLMTDAAHPENDPFDLLVSRDAGKTWTGVRPGDDLRRSMPAYWLAGARRTSVDWKKNG